MENNPDNYFKFVINELYVKPNDTKRWISLRNWINNSLIEQGHSPELKDELSNESSSGRYKCPSCGRRYFANQLCDKCGIKLIEQKDFTVSKGNYFAI